MSTNWPNDRMNDLPDHNPPTQEFIQDQGSFDIRHPSPGEWLEPSPPLPTRPYPALRPGPRFTNRQMIIIGAAVATVIVVLCGSLVAIGALSNHTTPIAKNPSSASAAATATASATLAASDNSGLPTTLPTFQPAATTAPGQPTPTVATTGTPQPNPTATPIPTNTPTRTGTFTDDLGDCSKASCSGLMSVSNPLDSSCMAPASPTDTLGNFIEWNKPHISFFQAIAYVPSADPALGYSGFNFYVTVDQPNLIQVFPTVTHDAPSKHWIKFTYTMTVSVNSTGSSLPNFVRVVWATQNVNQPELGQMTIIFQG